MSGTGAARSGSTDVETLLEEFQRSGLREFHVRADGFELYLSNEPGAGGIDVQTIGAPAAAAATAAPAPAAEPKAAAPTQPAASLPAGTTAVTAPYLGTFYRAPKPGAPNYVEVGQRVEAETELCLVEVMKLFTAVRAGVGGTIEAVLATDGQLVEAGQPLFAVRAG